jgi:hypothetical protein
MNRTVLPIARFKLGRIVSTPNALQQLEPLEILTAIKRHQAGDWGDVSDHDREANDQALTHGTRLLSVYHTERKCRFWLITEADRSVTTVLLPEDY